MMMNFKNFKVLSVMCMAAFCAALTACSTQEKPMTMNDDISRQTQNSTGDKVSDQAFTADSNVTTAAAISQDEDSKTTEEMGTRVRHKKSKRGIASVEAN